MTELDPNIVLKAFATPQLDIAGLMEQRDALQQRGIQRQRAEADYQTKQAAEQRRRTIGAQYAGGDSAGAQKAAIGEGDFDLATKFASLDDSARKRTSEISRATAPALYGLKRVAPPERLAALEQMAPRLEAAGFTREHIDQLAQGGLDDSALDRIWQDALTIDELVKQNENYTLSPGSKRFGPDGRVIAEVDFAPRTIKDENGNYIEYVPGASGGAPSRAPRGGGTLTVASVAPHIVAQESGGDYTARSPVGAMGAYQVMPETGRALAAQLGLPWQPALMTKSTPEAKAYQDKIGSAAIQEAIDNSGGDPATMAQYYHGGSNRGIWGPKTRQYGAEVVQRLGGGAAPEQPAGPRVIARGAPKAGWKTLSPAEAQAAGLPAGPVYQQSPQGEYKAVGGTAKAPAGVALPKVPASTVNAYVANNAALRKIKEAKSAVEGNKGAVGAWNTVTPDFAAQRIDPKGVKARALIADIGSLKIHDRSGAAVTASETPRLKPFIPTVSDTPATIGTKLDNFFAELEAMQQDMRDAYSNDAGESQLARIGRDRPAASAPRQASNVVRYDAQGNRIK